MISRSHVIALVGLIAAGCGCGPDLVQNHFRDADNRIVIYHGVNVCNYSKYAADFLPWQTKDDFARLREWGFNLVRYLVFWEAIEPEEGVYDDAYIEATVQRIRWLEELGIDVLIDFHQDLYCRKYGGNGFPVWTANDEGIPFTPRTPWNLNYLEPAVIACYRNFWNNDALKAKYVAAIRYMLECVDALPNVIGVDVMNEPFPDSILGFESGNLSRLYEDVLAMRNEAGFKARVFFEPFIFNSAGLRTGLTFRPDANCASAPHYYDPLCHEGFPYDLRAEVWLERVLRMRVKEANRFETPLLFGEFGVSPEVDNYLDYLSDWVSLTDRYQASWTYYSFDKASDEGFGIIDEEGNERAHLTRLVHVYPQRIAGEDPEFEYGTNEFNLSYDPIGTSEPTVIFIPRWIREVQAWVNDVEFPVTPGKQYLSVSNEDTAGNRMRVRLTWE